MIPYNNYVYGLGLQDYVSGAETTPIGTVTERFTYHTFNDVGTPLYSADCSKVFDESIYLWHIAPESSVGTNAAFCISVSDTLDLQIVYNKANNVPLAMQWCDIQNESFKRYPKGRMAYNYWSYAWFNYVQSKLFVDINRTKYCIRPIIQCYDFSTDTTTNQALSNVAAWINMNPENRIIFGVSFELYHGNTAPRTLDASYIPDTSTLGRPNFDILTDRPIPDNATGAKKDMQYDFNATDPSQSHDTWRTDKQYSPFTQAFTGLWYSGDTTVTAYNIGMNFSITVAKCRNGSQSSSWGGKVTGKFLRYSDRQQNFDDVSYTWSTKVYYPAAGQFLDSGFPLTSLSDSENLRVTTMLQIIDKKELSAGAAAAAAIKHEIAFLGFYFGDSLDVAQNAELGVSNTHVFLPEFIGGITTGNYFTGDDIPNVPYANSTTVSDDAFKYTPSDTDNDSGDLTTHIKSGAVSGGLWYKLTSAKIAALSTWLNTTYKPDEQTLSEDFKGVNPSDYIISLKYYPFEVTAGSSAALSIGSIDTGVTADLFSRIYGTGNSYFDLGSFTMQPPYCFGNFLDKYLKIQVYIPYCGFVDLDSTVYCPSPDGTVHTINIALQVDYATGQCVGLIYRDALLMDTVQGCCGVDIPFSAVQQGCYQNNVKQAELAIKQAKAGQLKSLLGAGGALIGTAAAAFTGNVPAVLLGTAATVNAVQGMKTADISRESADYNLEHTAPAVSGVESASPFNAMIQEDSAKILIYKPVLLQGADLAAYAKTTGYACCKQGKLSSFKGLTVCSSSQLNFDAPAAHKTQLQQMLAKGVYV